MNRDELMAYLKREGATHLLEFKVGGAIAYRKSQAFRNHYGFLHIANNDDEEGYRPSESGWLLTEQGLPENAKVIEWQN